MHATKLLPLVPLAAAAGIAAFGAVLAGAHLVHTATAADDEDAGLLSVEAVASHAFDGHEVQTLGWVLQSTVVARDGLATFELATFDLARAGRRVRVFADGLDASSLHHPHGCDAWVRGRVVTPAEVFVKARALGVEVPPGEVVIDGEASCGVCSKGLEALPWDYPEHDGTAGFR